MCCMQPKTPKLFDDICHGYDLIDPTIVWEIIQRDVPVLLAEVVALLGADEGPADAQP